MVFPSETRWKMLDASPEQLAQQHTVAHFELRWITGAQCAQSCAHWEIPKVE